MGMQIATNVAAINAQRNLSMTSLKMGKVLEKLSSGYRINRAADDAAGLGISEKMRSQIRGNAQALRNAQDGISMIQTAEGAMDEIHQILQRMRELSVQAANDTNDAVARTSIGTELLQLRAETVEWLLEVCDSTPVYRMRYAGQPRLSQMLNLLLYDEGHPMALAFHRRSIERDLDDLARSLGEREPGVAVMPLLPAGTPELLDAAGEAGNGARAAAVLGLG